MLNSLLKPPQKFNLAFSGGVDSLSAAHYLKSKHYQVTLLHFNHGCEVSDEIERQCRERAEMLGLPIIVKKNDSTHDDPKQSKEDFWRRFRYRFLRSFDETFLTCHHLDDAVETWLWSAMHGTPKIIPYRDEKVFRPFLMTDKSTLVEYANDNGLVPVYDIYNEKLTVMRNYIRQNIIEHAYVVNPGLKKVIRKKYIQQITADKEATK